MSEIIYGSQPVIEALRARLKIKNIIIARELKSTNVQKIISLASEQDLPIEFVSKKQLTDKTKNVKNQGIAALVEPVILSKMEDVCTRSKQLNEPPFIALLDGIQDPHNLGAIIRSVDGAGLHGVILPKRRSVGMTSTVVKTSAGAAAHVLVVQVSNLNYTMEQLKKENIWIVGADEHAEQIYYEADLSGALGLVIGTEGKGLHRLVKEKCDYLVRIPMLGKVNSLNASVAAALLFFEARKQRQLKIT